MKAVMLLLVPVVGMLLSPAFAKPHPRPTDNLNRIIDLAEKYNDSLTEKTFVEDVSDLADGSDRCGTKFFCKVHEILVNVTKKYKHPHKNAEMELMMNLSVYINSTNMNCTEALTQVTPSEVTKPLPVLVSFLEKCCKHKNLNAA